MKSSAIQSSALQVLFTLAACSAHARIMNDALLGALLVIAVGIVFWCIAVLGSVFNLSINCLIYTYCSSVSGTKTAALAITVVVTQTMRRREMGKMPLPLGPLGMPPSWLNLASL